MESGKVQSPLMQVIDEMMHHAANDIGVEHCEENVDQIIADLENNYGIKLNTEGPVHVGLLETICSCVLEWRNNTLNNYPEMRRKD